MNEIKLSNPFIFKKPVREELFVGRTELIEKIYTYINAGESVSLVGERRTGKTSVLIRVLDLKEQHLRYYGQHVLVFKDFLGWDYHNESSIWVMLLSTLLEEITSAGIETKTVNWAIEQIKAGELASHTLLKMFRSLGHDGIRVTFLFDEFEATVQAENSVDLSFFKILRNLAIDKDTRLSFVIATRQELSTVERTLERQYTSLSSPLFNIFHQLIILPFSKTEALKMINNYLDSIDMSIKLNVGIEQDFLFQLSGFHPFFMQIACHHLFEHCVLPDGTFSDQVPVDKITFAFMNESNSHFAYYWDISSKEEKQLMIQLSVNAAEADIQSCRPVLNSLHNRCLVVRDETDSTESEWRLFSSVFAKWIMEQKFSHFQNLKNTKKSYSEVQKNGTQTGKFRSSIRLTNSVIKISFSRSIFIFIIIMLIIAGIVGYIFYNQYYKFDMKFAKILPGAVMMGSSENEINRDKDEKQRKVTISKDFYLQTTEVTQGQWKEIMGTTPWAGKDHIREGPDYPAVYVSWDDCQEFIQKLNQSENTSKYRLPTETEWEYACRAGSNTRFSWGDDADCSKGNFGRGMLINECDENPGKATTVKSFDPNVWGIYDMHGNVWEWCQDKSDNGSDLRVVRGGSWHNSSRFCRSANRGSIPANSRLKDVGFRLVKEMLIITDLGESLSFRGKSKNR